MRNRAKESTAKDILGIFGILISIVLLMYLLIEHYMGYTGLKRLFMTEHHAPVERVILPADK